MRNSKVCSKKHTHSFHCEDQRSQDLKKIVQARLESNSFVIREVPIQRLFNVEHCTNASSDLSGFTKGKNFSTGMNVMDYDMPELVVFIQEDHQQFVKDIGIHRGLSPEGKCLCDPGMNRRSDINIGIMEAVSINSTGSECACQHPSFKDEMKMHDFRNLMMKGEVELDSGDKISIDQPTKKTTSETLREAFRKEREFSRSFKNWQINSFLGTYGSRVEFPHFADCLQQVTDTSMYRPEMAYSQSLTGSRQVDYPQETSDCALGPLPGPTSSYTGHATTSSSASHQSNDSISSTHSFAFPILPVEWNGSPVRMLEADKSQSSKPRWRKIWFPCCNGDS